MHEYSGRILAVVAILSTMAAVAGCAPRSTPVTGSAKPLPSPSASAGPGYSATVTSPEFALSDKQGRPVLQMTAQSGAGVSVGNAEGLGELTKGRATLYRDGKAAATLTADKMKVDSKTRILTATGSVLVRSRNDTDGIPKSVRADTMRWEYDKDRISGQGHVVLSYGTVVQIPGSSFVADTTIQNNVKIHY